MKTDSLKQRYTRFREGIDRRDPQAIFLAITMVLLLVFTSTLSWLYVRDGPTELAAPSFGGKGPGAVDDGTSDPGNSATDPTLETGRFNSNSERMTVSTDDFEETRKMVLVK